MVEAESHTNNNNNNWFLNNHQQHNNQQHNIHSNNNNSNNTNGTFLQPLPLNNSSTGLNKSIEWLYEQSLTASTKATKLSNGFTLLQDGTQSPSSFLNLSSTGGGHEEPVQVPILNNNNNINNDHNNSFQYTVSPLLQPTTPPHTLLQSLSYQQSSPISLVPQTHNSNNNNSSHNNYYSSPSSEGSSPIQDYYSPSSSPLTIPNTNDSSPIPTFSKTTPNYQFNSLKQTTGIPPTISTQITSTGQNTTTQDFSYYNYVEQSLLNQINLSHQNPVLIQTNTANHNNNNNIQFSNVPTISSSTPSSPNQITHINNTTINNNNIIQQQPSQQQQQQPILLGISSHNIIHNMSEEEIEKPFNPKKFQDVLKSIVPTYDENHNILSESSGHSESSQSDFDEISDQRQVSVKKRGREQEEIDVSGVTILPRDKVLKLTSKEIEEYVSRLKQNHVLTQAEEKDLKKQRRLVKNREYASQSRSRRKVYVESIESKLQKTNQDCQSIKNQLNQVKEENKMLKKQLYSIVSTLKSDSGLAQAFGKLFAPLGNNKPSSTTTLFIFIFLFTFTFLFKSPISFNSPSSTITFNSESASLQRNLLEFEEPTTLPSSEWKKAILEETKHYVDGLVNSIYSNIKNIKEISETKLDNNNFLPVSNNKDNMNNTNKKEVADTTITTDETPITPTTSDTGADDEITNIFGKVSLDDTKLEEQQSFEDFKEQLRSSSPPLSIN